MPQGAIVLPKEYHDQIVCGDSIEIMRQMPDGCVDLVVTSPPYNLRAGMGRGTLRNRPGGLAYPKVMVTGYDGHSDDLPSDEYVAWQRACLLEMLRLIPDHGAIFYNHKWRIQRGLLQDHQAILDGLPLRQIIIWSRRLGINFSRTFFRPTYEVIYLIAKPGFKLAPRANAVGDVWTILPEQYPRYPHPAPFPLSVPLRIIGATEASTILDPFMGSGTTAVAAKQLRRVFWASTSQSGTARWRGSGLPRHLPHSRHAEQPDAPAYQDGERHPARTDRRGVHCGRVVLLLRPGQRLAARHPARGAGLDRPARGSGC